MKKTMADEAMAALKGFLRGFVQDSVTHAEHQNRSTIQKADVHESLGRKNIAIYGGGIYFSLFCYNCIPVYEARSQVQPRIWEITTLFEDLRAYMFQSVET